VVTTAQSCLNIDTITAASTGDAPKKKQTSRIPFRRKILVGHGDGETKQGTLVTGDYHTSRLAHRDDQLKYKIQKNTTTILSTPSAPSIPFDWAFQKETWKAEAKEKKGRGNLISRALRQTARKGSAERRTSTTGCWAGGKESLIVHVRRKRLPPQRQREPT